MPDEVPHEARRKVEALSQELTERRPQVEQRLDYFKGKVGRLKFATDEFSRYHGDRFAGLSDNWCAPVVTAASERMHLLGVRLGDARRSDPELMRIWDSNDCERGSSEAFAVSMASAYAYALVHPASSPTDMPRVTWEHPTQAIVDRDPVTGDTRAGLVQWVDDEHDFATLYTPTEVLKWQRSRSPQRWDQKLPTTGGGWEPREVENEDWPFANPLGEVPLVEFRNQTLLDEVPISDIAGVMPMQDTINLVWAYLLNALDFASLPGRVVTGADTPRTPVLDKDGQETGLTRPVPLDQLIKDRILWVPTKGATIGEWTAANLDAFSKVIEHAVDHIAAQTRTPPHYLIAKMVNAAAESLTVSEAGLVSRTGERLTYARAPVRRIFRLIALAVDDREKADLARTATLRWRNIQYRSEAQLADALSKKRQMGYPLRYLLELDGLDPDEVDRVMAMAEEESRDPLGERIMGRLDGAALGGG